MLYSKLFGKTQKSSKKFDSDNATYLIKGGFIDQTMAGVYTFLPLGLKVLENIETIVREEMDEIGNELLMPALSPMDLWEKTDRLNNIDVLYKVLGANEDSLKLNDSEYILNSTQEELITPIAKKFNTSYKTLPTAVYQIQNKFRNEARPKSGLLRTREFRMKDLYSFHRNEREFKEYYELAKEAYKKVYKRLGLGDITYITLASGGDFTDEYSHEFQTKCETGEDLIFYDHVNNIYYNKEVAPSKTTNPHQEKEDMQEKQIIETPGKKTVEEISSFLELPVTKTIKTVLFENENQEFAAVAVRGDYEVNEIKVKKILGWKKLKMATDENVTKVTGAEPGYAGILDLPDEVSLIVDDSLQNIRNLECGANKTDHHVINVNFGRDIPEPKQYHDIKLAKEEDLIPGTNEKYTVFAASEVGNIFPLETKFTDAFEYTYTDKNGEEQPVLMGSYGIGTTRLMGVLAEIFNDEHGLIWPEQVAPFKIHMVGLNMDNNEIKDKVFGVYMNLIKAGMDVLLDDREDVSAGEKFLDADLIGCPLRAVVSKKTKEGHIEYKKREEQESKVITIEEFINLFS